MTSSPDAAAVTRPRRTLPIPVGVLLAVVAGLAFALQSRINGAVAGQFRDGFAAAALSFGVGTVVLVTGVAVIPAGRRRLARVFRSVRAGELPAWYLVAGAIGANVVLAQSLTVGVLGVAIFTVALVAGQTISGVLVDGTGFGARERRPPTLPRIAGSVLTVVAVVWAVESSFGTSTDPAAVVGPILLPVVAGLLYGFQQAMNGRIGRIAGTPMIPAVTNFTVGLIVLLIAWAIKQLVAPTTGTFPAMWWAYLPGLLGIVAISLSALLAPRLGVLLLGLGTIAGQLLGSLGLDVFAPAAGAHVALSTVGGTALTLIAVLVATLPWRSQRRFAEAGRRAHDEAARSAGPATAEPTGVERPAR
ncbi:membrane protein [Tersicoccus solisilvae]|uniref:Membrane protein n=1 Tax=Tersicoccus solisilvae TaxID=1882339 RepID=A0ABQ1PLB5_9MICC|nr:DMT family transporter [Tersicoccus solisilvae]GGC99087.1 membrane protein [Tersicoccus solisilvae]